MKQEWKGAAHILRFGNFGESHVWLRLLLADRGVATAFAFGGARSLRRFCGCLDTFNELSCRISVSERRDFTVLEEATLVNAPRRLRRDWRRMGVAANCLSFTEALAVGREGSRECFALVSDLREYLENAREISSFLPLFFRLRLASALGYAPGFSACVCGAVLSEGGFFLSHEGRVFCPDCTRGKRFVEKRHSFWLSPGAIALASACEGVPVSAMPLLEAGGDCLRQCGRAINDFVEYQMGLAWENGRFRRI